jgi:hypothetical protein
MQTISRFTSSLIALILVISLATGSFAQTINNQGVMRGNDTTTSDISALVSHVNLINYTNVTPAGSIGSPAVYAEMVNNNRMIGRLFINSVDMTPVAVYAADANELENKSSYWNGQAVSDREDSAHAWAVDGGIVIGDHVQQNFGVLVDVSVGDIAYLNRGDSVITLCCIGTNDEIYLGETGGYIDVADTMGGMKNHVLIYTCKDWPYITATMWEVVSGDLSDTYAECDSRFHYPVSWATKITQFLNGFTGE